MSLLALLVALFASPSATVGDEAEELLAIVTAPVVNAEEASLLATRSGEWLEATRGREFPGSELLVLVARYYRDALGAEDAARSELDDLVRYLDKHDDRLPVEGLRPVVARLLLWYGVWLTDMGHWETAVRELPRILRFQERRHSVYWLMGRRGRDAEKADVAAGHAFLHDTIIPSILDDHELDDVDRVYLLRRLYAVDYTGPRPFQTVTGPDLDGRTVSSDSLLGHVALVVYWATW